MQDGRASTPAFGQAEVATGRRESSKLQTEDVKKQIGYVAPASLIWPVTSDVIAAEEDYSCRLVRHDHVWPAVRAGCCLVLLLLFWQSAVLRVSAFCLAARPHHDPGAAGNVWVGPDI